MASDAIGAGLIERIRERVKDDWRRTGEGDYQRMPKELRRKHPEFSGGVAGMLLNAAFGSYDPGPQPPLKPIEPMSAKAVEKVEKTLGFKLPHQLRQLYLEVGDGGFGPFWGIRRLSNWAKDYLKLRADMLAERGREWPEELLPIVYMNGKRICVERHSGEVILWTKPPKKCSEKKWVASFVPQSPTVEAWLERWVDTPSFIEDGPEGGWSPPDEEIARREAVVQEAEAKRAAEAEKARTVNVAEIEPIPDDLLARIAERAMDPDKRTYMASAAARSSPFDLDSLEDDLVNSADVLPKDAFTMLAGMLGGLRKLAPLAGGMPGMNMVMGPGPGMVGLTKGAGGKLGAPATEAAFAHAANELGFELPAPLKQLLRIADGGFGPGDGLLSVARMLKRHRKLNAKPQGPNGETWPARLFPIWEAGEEIGLIDLETGAISSYDVSRMQDIHGGYFKRSFAKEAGSLAELMERWLGESTFDEDMVPGSPYMRAARANLPPEEDPAEIAVKYFEGNPQMRNDAGLPETGWEEEVRRWHRGY